jgi:hypothetical protein
MLRNVKDLRAYALRATDGVIGRVEDFYFDDEEWGVTISSSIPAAGCPTGKC